MKVFSFHIYIINIVNMYINITGAPKKKRVERILEDYITNMKTEKENVKRQRDEERQKREERKEVQYIERKQERERMHNENLEVQKSLLTVLQNLINKT